MQVLSESVGWMGQAVADFGLAACDVPSLLKWSKECLASTNAGVRNAAVQLLGVMHR
jgi:cytoskeleton-associated protein 5